MRRYDGVAIRLTAPRVNKELPAYQLPAECYLKLVEELASLHTDRSLIAIEDRFVVGYTGESQWNYFLQGERVKFANRDCISRLDTIDEEKDFFSDPRRTVHIARITLRTSTLETSLNIRGGAYALITPKTEFDYPDWARRTMKVLTVGLEYYENGILTLKRK